jgi:hypothetical protein
MFFKNGTRKNFYLKTVVSLLLTVILMLTATACNEANYGLTPRYWILST